MPLDIRLVGELLSANDALASHVEYLADVVQALLGPVTAQQRQTFAGAASVAGRRAAEARKSASRVRAHIWPQGGRSR